MLPVTWDTLTHYLKYERRASASLVFLHRIYRSIEHYFCDKPFNKQTVFAYLDTLSHLSPATINNRIKLIRNIGRCAKLDWTQEIRYLTLTEEIRDTLTPDELRAILSTPGKYQEQIELLAATGIRVGELASIEWKDIRGDRIILRKTKTNVQRVIIISPTLTSLLQSLPHNGDRVFNRSPVTQQMNINAELRRRAKLCGIDKHITTHTFRRTVATESASRGANLAHIAKYLGHASVETTAHYIQTDEEALRQVASKLTVNEDAQTLEHVAQRLESVLSEFSGKFNKKMTRSKNRVMIVVSS